MTRELRKIFDDFSTVLRFVTVETPRAAEQAWSFREGFRQLPKQTVLSPGVKWFASSSGGTIGYYEFNPETGRGRYYRSLPPDVRAQDVLLIPVDSASTALLAKLQDFTLTVERMGTAEKNATRMRLTVDQLVERLYAKGREPRAFRDILNVEMLILLFGDDPNMALSWLEAECEHAWDKLGHEVDGSEVAAVAILEAVMRAVIEAWSANELWLPGNFFEPLLEPGDRALHHVVCQMITRALLIGGKQQVEKVAYLLKDEAEEYIETALTGYHEFGDQRSWSRFFYPCLYQANPRLNAADQLFGLLLQYADAVPTEVREGERTAWMHECNNVEEKFVRTLYALQFSVENLNGEEFAKHRQHVRKLVDEHRLDDVDALLLNLIENSYFYPRPMRGIFLP